MILHWCLIVGLKRFCLYFETFVILKIAFHHAWSLVYIDYEMCPLRYNKDVLSLRGIHKKYAKIASLSGRRKIVLLS